MTGSALRGVVAGGMLAAAAFGMVTAVGAVDEPSSVVKYRQATMSAIGGHMGALSGIAKGEVSFTDDAEMHAGAIQALSEDLGRLFPAGSTYEADHSTKALPEIWSQPDQFQQAIESFQAESAKMVEAAASGDQVTIAQQLGSLGQNGCSNCHDTFRYKE